MSYFMLINYIIMSITCAISLYINHKVLKLNKNIIKNNFDLIAQNAELESHVNKIIRENFKLTEGKIKRIEHIKSLVQEKLTYQKQIEKQNKEIELFKALIYEPYQLFNVTGDYEKELNNK